MKVGVPIPNNNQEAEDMDVNDTADVDTSWEDMVVDASGHINQ